MRKEYFNSFIQTNKVNLLQYIPQYLTTNQLQPDNIQSTQRKKFDNQYLYCNIINKSTTPRVDSNNSTNEKLIIEEQLYPENEIDINKISHP